MLVNDTRVAVMGVINDIRTKEFQKNTGLTILARARFKTLPDTAIQAFDEVNFSQGNNASAYVWWGKREEERGYQESSLEIRVYSPRSVGVLESRNNMQKKVASQLARLLMQEGLFVSITERHSRRVYGNSTFPSFVAVNVDTMPSKMIQARKSWHSIWGLDDIPFQGTYGFPRVDNYRWRTNGIEERSELDKLQDVHAATVRVLKSRQISVQVSNISKQTQREPIFHGTASQVLAQMGKTTKARGTNGRFTAKVAVA
jgi:hypothetical protein